MKSFLIPQIFTMLSSALLCPSPNFHLKNLHLKHSMRHSTFHFSIGVWRNSFKSLEIMDKIMEIFLSGSFFNCQHSLLQREFITTKGISLVKLQKSPSSKNIWKD